MQISPLLFKIKRKFKDNFAQYAQKFLFIRQKSGKIALFQLNKAQKHIHRCLEMQLEREGHVRALIVKGRQQGCSTYIAARFFWKATHRSGVRVFILSHLETASRNIVNIVKRYHQYCPSIMRPRLTQSNQKDMIFGHLDSGYKIGTANSHGVGRSDTVQYFHGSEVAYWAHARDHLSGILQSIPEGQETEVILESTSDGPQDVFYEMCKNAQNGDSRYQLIFVPWFWQDEYKVKAPRNLVLTADEKAYQDQYKLTRGQVLWRRYKIAELGGIGQFRREYPATIDDAFHSDTKGALWQRQQIEKNRVHQKDCPDFERIVVAIDPAVSHTKKSDETGIIVAARGTDGHGYVLEDASGRYSPAAWAKRAADLFDRYQANQIIVETNQGGDMAVHTLRTQDARLPIKKLHASRGKWTRAEPVAALDEQERIHHVGQFVTLEDQMCGFKPGTMQHSPDRVDARVWAMTDLMLGPDRAKPKIWNI